MNHEIDRHHLEPSAGHTWASVAAADAYAPRSNKPADTKVEPKPDSTADKPPKDAPPASAPGKQQESLGRRSQVAGLAPPPEYCNPTLPKGPTDYGPNPAVPPKNFDPAHPDQPYPNPGNLSEPPKPITTPCPA